MGRPRKRIGHDFGTRLRKARTIEALTLRALAKRSGVSESSLSRFEAGLSAPGFADVCSIARTLGWPLLYFATGVVRGGTDPRHLAAQLRHWGLSDQPVDAILGEARPFEELIVEGLSEHSTPRLIEAVPALLLRNAFDRAALSSIATSRNLLHRVGWASEMAEWIATRLPVHCIHPDALPRLRAIRTSAWKKRPDGKKWEWDIVVPVPEDLRDPVDAGQWLESAIMRTPQITQKWRLVFDTKQERFLERAREILTRAERG